MPPLTYCAFSTDFIEILSSAPSKALVGSNDSDTSAAEALITIVYVPLSDTAVAVYVPSLGVSVPVVIPLTVNVSSYGYAANMLDAVKLVYASVAAVVLPAVCSSVPPDTAQFEPVQLPAPEKSRSTALVISSA